MGRLIDEDILIGSIPDLNAFEEEDFCTSDMVHLIEDTPTVEAIPKADYENCLKADMVAMLDKIRADFINAYPKNYAGEPELGGSCCVFSLNKVLKIIDKYKIESEE